MPFEAAGFLPQRIAIIGGGISGLGAAHLLAGSHTVTLFEAESRLGGHARTVIAGKNMDQPVDTGFIVFNYANYPRMAKLFDLLEVPVAKSNMSFAVSAESGRLEYAIKEWPDLFAQKRNILRPAYLNMLRDILRFNKNASEMARSRPDLTLVDLISELGLGKWFRDYYLLPFSGAIWSSPLEQMMEFPALALVEFFENHHLLATNGQHQWYTVKGGSNQYVRRLLAQTYAKGAEIRIGAPVKGVKRVENGAMVRAQGGEWEGYDHVIFACHSDQALAILADPTEEERNNLGAMRYQENKAVLHRDPAVMPKRKQCWASWNYVTTKQTSDAPVGVSYWMNSLQPISKSDPIFQSLNPAREIRDELIFEETSFAHPVFDAGALAAQKQMRELQGQNNTYFCGAYMRNGFHEDGYSSAVDVVEHLLGHQVQWA